jgi:hypothetical protein
MTRVDEQLEFVKLIASRLDSEGIPYMVTGSMAMLFYAVPRMTRDIDLVIECFPGDSERIARLFENDCYLDRERIRDAIVRRSMFNAIHSEWIVKADFIVRKDDEYRKKEFGRRRKFEHEKSQVYVVAPEDLILSKLLWGKESDSELQRRDVRAMIEAVPDLDWSYLEEWASSLGVREMLERERNP